MNRPAEVTAEPRWQPLFALLAIALLAKGLVWTYAIPPFDAPDEPAHYSHAQFLALRGRLPDYGGLEHASPDVETLTASILLPVPPGPPKARLLQERAGPGPVGPAETAVARAAQEPLGKTPSGYYGPVGYILYAIPIRLLSSDGLVAQLMGARLVAVLLGAVAALAVAWAGLEAGLEARMAVAAGIITGYQPMWSQQTAVVTADAALFCFASLSLALLLRWVRRPTPRAGLLTAAALAVTLLSKPAGLFALPFAALFFLPALQVRGPARLRAIGWGLGLGVLAALPFLAWNTYRPAGVASFTHRGTLSQYAQLFRAGGLAYPRSLVGQFWGNFGWLEQSLPPAPITALRYLSVAAGLVCVGALLKRASGRWAILLGLAYFVACAAIAFGFDLLLWLNQHDLGIQGRYMLPALGGAAVALVVALNNLLPKRVATLTVVIAAGGMMVLNFVSLAALAGRYLVS